MPEYMTKCEPVDKKPYIVYTDEKGILYSGDPDSDIPGGGVVLGSIIMIGVADGNGDSIPSEYRIGIGESIAANTFMPEMVGAAVGSLVDIVITEIAGDPVTGNETVTAEFTSDGDPVAFTDFTKSLKDDALHIEFTMPNVEADLFLAFTVSAAI